MTTVTIRQVSWFREQFAVSNIRICVASQSTNHKTAIFSTEVIWSQNGGVRILRCKELENDNVLTDFYVDGLLNSLIYFIKLYY